MATGVLDQRGGIADKGSKAMEKILVAVKTSREIPETAIAWALAHVAQPGDFVTLLVVVPSRNLGRRFWGFPRLSGDCTNRNRGYSSSGVGVPADMSSNIMEAYSKLILKLKDGYDPEKKNVKVKIVPGSPCGAVSAESKRIHASWVVLDRKLKKEEKKCLAELQCNIVAMRHSQPKVLRLHLVGSSESETQVVHVQPHQIETLRSISKKEADTSTSTRGPAISSTSSPDVVSSFTGTDAGGSSISSSEPGTSPFSASEVNRNGNKKAKDLVELPNDDPEESESDKELASPAIMYELHPWAADILNSKGPSLKLVQEILRNKTEMKKALMRKSCKHNEEAGDKVCKSEFDSSFRRVTSMSRNESPVPSLCSICEHKAPIFGKPPRWFSYGELVAATNGFSKANFLAEGGFGTVYKGILADGQLVAVKQHKLASSQGDLEFTSEVEVLSCAQHRNVVMLIGYCAEDRRRLLVYEYVCNGSLDSHLYGQKHEALIWSARQKIAKGAARGLRYLHEECRVGCIVHRDMRPNNILVTHDFEPQVGDFGLARWQPDGQVGVKTRVIGTFGYLAPEYAQSGHVTEKADIYSFGVVLLELISGRRAVDLSMPKGQQCLTEWVRPLLEEFAIEDLVDPRLGGRYSKQEVLCMLYAAHLCIRLDPTARPRMSQVIRVLEGDIVPDPNCLAPRYDICDQSPQPINLQEQENNHCSYSRGSKRYDMVRIRHT